MGGVVQIRVIPKTRNPFTIKSLSISGVTWKWHFLNHAEAPVLNRGQVVRGHLVAQAITHVDHRPKSAGLGLPCHAHGVAQTGPKMRLLPLARSSS